MSETCGIMAAFLFIIANAYYPAKLIAKRFRPWPMEMRRFFKQYLQVHVTLNLIAFLLVILHGHYAEADEKNIILQITLVLTLWLTIAGVLMYYQIPHGMNKRYLRLVHTQQIVFALWLILIIAGHSLG
ncbi:MAG: hypothetical protein AMK71_09825 [Nitrospira bacterium SG8_35_4]|nr:MAG: hypothetical protein AMK71_09825 [Nitrospira bacterium SG8_35_4]